MCHRTRLTKPIRLVNFNPQPLIHHINKFLRQRRSTARYHLDRTQVILIHHLIPRQPYNHRRRNVYERDLVILDSSKECLHVERRHDDEFYPAVQHLVHQPGEPVDMEERQYAEKLVFGGSIPVPN